MSPRPKSTKTNGLPLNLSPTGNGYFRYQPPADITLPNGKVLPKGKNIGMGKDRARAIEAAKELNAMLPANPILARVLHNKTPVEDFVDHFETELLPDRQKERNLSPKYIRNHFTDKLPHIKKHFKGRYLEDLTVKDCAKFFNTFTAHQANKYRMVMSILFTYAIAEGLRANNPADATMPKFATVTRQRLSIKGYRAVYEHAPEWARNAFDLALITLQRREDVAVFRFRKTEEATAYLADEHLYVIQQKTRKYGESAYIRMPLKGSLLAVVERCRDDIASPFMVHKMPRRRLSRNKRAKGREHPTQVMESELTRAFARAREASKFYKDLPEEARPTFHEIRALGADLYRQAGIDPQTLLGHTSEKQTKVYLSRHDNVKWTEAVADLEIAR